MNTLIVILAPVLMLLTVLMISGIIVALIAKARGFEPKKWFVVGMIIPYLSIAIVLLWPKHFEHTTVAEERSK